MESYSVMYGVNIKGLCVHIAGLEFFYILKGKRRGIQKRCMNLILHYEEYLWAY